MHLLWAILLFWEPTAAPVTPQWLLVRLGTPRLVSLLLLGSTLMSSLVLLGRLPLLGLGPQAYLMLLSLVDALLAIGVGTYPNGYTPVPGNPHLFILRDQLPLLSLIVVYLGNAFALTRQHRVPG